MSASGTIYSTLGENAETGVPIWLWAPVNEVESDAIDQLKRVAALPWVFHHVAVMPDVHVGKGATVGSVIAMKDAIAPAAVGVDIGCGMAAVKLSLKANDLPDNLKELRDRIEGEIPVGFNAHENPVAFGAPPEFWGRFKNLHPGVQDLAGRAQRQCGTLGGGNHFIELCLDQNDDVWLVLHSGSRNIGKTLADIHISIARKLAHNADLPDRDLAVFLAETPEFKAYRHDLMWAQEYARYNREVMLDLALHTISDWFTCHWQAPVIEGFRVVCHHNYVAEEIHYAERVLVTRKGAIRAGKGEWGIIPGSMGTKSYIVRGKGSAESFESASHGAGRRMSRGAAKRAFTLEQLAAQTAGVECRKDAGVLDEIPGAYKPIEQVMARQSDLVEIVYELRQVLCVKG